MQPLEAAILRTILYADIFDFPLTLEEIHYFLIHTYPASLHDVQNCLQSSTYLKQRITLVPPYYSLSARTKAITRRAEKQPVINKLLRKSLIYGQIIGCIPYVRMVAITGALAANNPTGYHDDLDYIIVTEPGRVWLTRAMIIILVRIARRLGTELCPNYVLASNKLLQNRQTLFIAREIAQMIPIYGLEMYHQFREANAWSQKFQPNAHSDNIKPPGQISSVMQRLKSALEWVLSGRIGNTLENWEFERKRKRFEPQTHTPQSAAQIDQNQVKGHFNDYGNPIMHQYHERIMHYGLDHIELPNAED